MIGVYCGIIYTHPLYIHSWLGLLHTFQKLVSDIPCDADEEGYGDFVDDTPFQDGPSSSGRESCIRFLGGTRPLPDTCPDLPGVDVSWYSVGRQLFETFNYTYVSWYNVGCVIVANLHYLYIHSQFSIT